MDPLSQNTTQQDKIKVVLVDDSAVIRGALSRILRNDPNIEIVGSVSNGEIGIAQARVKQPDILILDVEMPVMDGITALPKILQASPKTKVIMCSTLTEKGADITIKALALGAVDAIAKPTSSTETGPGSPFQRDLLALIENLVPRLAREQRITAPRTSSPPTAATAPRTAIPAASAPASFSLHKDPAAYKGKPDLIAIGSSTGGPQALFKVLKNFTGFNVPIVITQHMPPTFTRILADHIRQQTGIPSHEGEDDMPLERGHIYVAPGGKHMLFTKEAGAVKIKLDDGPQENFCKPAVDPMYRSLIGMYGNRFLGIILTGMGHDGLEGGKLLVEKGGRLIAQDEKTSVVWGMPGAVAMNNLCTAVLPIDEIGPWVRKAMLM